MRHALWLAVMCSATALAARPSLGQQDGGERIASSWTTTTVSGQGQPRGYVEYEKYCSACHAKGSDRPGTLALAAKYKGTEPAVLDERTDLTAPLVKTYVRNGITVMPFFRKTEISDAELDAIALYLTRNAKP